MDAVNPEVSDEEHAAVRLLREHDWIVFRPTGQLDRVTSVAALKRGIIALLAHGQLLAELSPFDAETLGRDLIDLANTCLEDPEYPG